MDCAGRLLELLFGSGSNTALQPFDLHWSWACNNGLESAEQLCCLPLDQEPSMMKIWFSSSVVDTSAAAMVGCCSARACFALMVTETCWTCSSASSADSVWQGNSERCLRCGRCSALPAKLHPRYPKHLLYCC